jgi:putative effector of murein hydrolase
VAFAIPIYEQRILIRRHWPILLVGVTVGSFASIVSGWMLASAFGLSDILRISLLPRSITTPFAMAVSQDMGGAPELTAVFVAATGVFGALIGELILRCLPLQSALARGALFGMGAHGAGVAKAREVGQEEGAVAGLVMVMVGVSNVLAATLILHFVGKH